MGRCDPINAWFKYPLHVLDPSLADIKLDEDPKENWKKGTKKANQSRSEKSKQELETAFSALSIKGESVSVEDIAEYLDISRQSIYNKVKKHETFKISEGYVEKQKEE